MISRIRAFGHSLRGGKTLLASQAHAKIHLVATIVVIGLAVYYRVSATEWLFLLMAIGMVWMAEAMNTAIEFLADEVTLEWRERIKKAKDTAAFGVLAATMTAMAIGAVIFWPHLLKRL
jgi:diacylglycerol kinase (ATP)